MSAASNVACCPHCGAVLQLEPACVVEEPYFPRYPLRDEPLPRRERVTAVALCTGCEFVIELPSGVIHY